MKLEESAMASRFRAFWKDPRGVTAPIVAIAMVGLIGMAGLAIDLGRAFYVSRSLQASSDAAALAGAMDINCCTTPPGGTPKAITTAREYSGIVGGRNRTPGQTVTMAAGYPQLRCFQNILNPPPCPAPDNANGIVVRQEATVPTYFAKILGIRTIPVTTHSSGTIRGGQTRNLDVMIVLDTTGSMRNTDPSCSLGNNAKQIDCALKGIQVLLENLNPETDQVGLLLFPGLTSVFESPKEYDCASPPNPTIASYNSSPNYLITELSNDFKTSKTSPLATSSNLVKAVGGSAGCTPLYVGSGSSTYFADALTAARGQLLGAGRPESQKVIIFLGDGDAHTTDFPTDNSKRINQCKDAVTAAQLAAVNGIWVYSIAYGALTSGSCSSDVVPISACETMRKIASDQTKFYSDKMNASTGACNSAAQPISELVAVFRDIAESLKAPRLLPPNAS